MNKIFLTLLVLATFSAHAQQKATIRGTVKNSTGSPLALVQIMAQQFGCVSGKGGEFEMEVVAGNYTLTANLLNYTPVEQMIQVKAGETKSIDFVLQDAVQSLNQSQVIGKSQNRKIQELSYSVVAIDAKQFHNSSANMNQVLNQMAGIKVREDGGLGSGFSFSINGFSGKQVKFFLDGVSMDNFGSSMSINNLSINQADRIEVYKGVVPVWLGTDALGGAVNIVTNSSKKNYIDASYTYGSFNTHKANVSMAYANPKSGFVVHTNLFYNYADNNYPIDAQVANLSTGELGKVQKVNRFHDAYQSLGFQFETGITQKKFADKLLFGLIASENSKDIQTGATSETVYGGIKRKGKGLIPTLKFAKNHLFTDGLSLQVNALYNISEDVLIDTLHRRYNWLGEYIDLDGVGGEFKLKHYTAKNRGGLLSATTTYTFSPAHNVVLNYSYNNFRRTGSDAVNKANSADIYPQSLHKNLWGLAYKFDHKLLSITGFTKLYAMSNASQELSDIFDLNSSLIDVSSQVTKTGYGFALSYFVFPKLQLKGSFEHAYRLPDNEELFGDGLFMIRSPSLQPEQSNNLNIEALFSTYIQENHRLSAELNLIYRDAKDLIRNELRGIQTVAINLRDARTTGVDVDLKYAYADILQLGINGSYQNIRNTTEYEGDSQIVSFYYKDRLPNIPYLFGNADATVTLRKVGYTDASLSFNWSLNYVHSYYLKWPSLGTADTKMMIPQQLTQNVSTHYALKDGRYNISLECANLFNQALFDHYRLQKPGRAFYVKLRLRIN